MSDNEPFLEVENLRTVFYTEKETVYAVDDVDLQIERGETLGIVGESGSGKSVTAQSIMGLIEPPGRILEESSIRLRGRELTTLSEKEYQQVRGNEVTMVFQDPMTSLNPVYTVGNQIKEVLRLHQGLSGQEATEEALELLQAVGIPDATQRLNEYPHQYSGGMRQRAVIARALACDPTLLICDEPTTALDVTIQAQILELLEDIQRERDLAIMFITHDIGVIAEVSDRVNVMYAGEIVEKAPVVDLFDDPSHPYTQGLLQSLPGNNLGRRKLETIDGDVPTPNESAKSCRFAPRCPKAFEACNRVHPRLVSVTEDAAEHSTACLLYPDDRSRSDAIDIHRTNGEETEVRE